MEALEIPSQDRSGPRCRKKRQRHRLQSKFKSLLEDVVDLAIVGPDPFFQALLRGMTQQPPTVVAFQVIARETPITIVGVPTRIWVNPKAMAVLMQVKRRMRERHRSCVLLPQDAIHAVPAMAANYEAMHRLFSVDVDPVAIGSCDPNRAHDPVGCFAYMMASGQPCPGGH